MESQADGHSSSDAHGRAALLLVESLIHALVARSVLSVPEALEIMEVALDAQIAVAEDAAKPPQSMLKASALLSSLLESLRIDLPEPIAAPDGPAAP